MMTATPHLDWSRLQTLLPAVREYQKLANEHGINDIFQDNGGKILQMLLALGLKGLPGREGNDAVDEEGREYELKSVNLFLTSSFSTHHHINPTIIAKYELVEWFFAVFEDIEMRRIWRVEQAALASVFAGWGSRWHASGGKDINNPKIALPFVMQHGYEVYSDGVPLDLKRAAQMRASRSAANRRAREEAAGLGLFSGVPNSDI